MLLVNKSFYTQFKQAVQSLLTFNMSLKQMQYMDRYLKSDPKQMYKNMVLIFSTPGTIEVKVKGDGIHTSMYFDIFDNNYRLIVKPYSGTVSYFHNGQSLFKGSLVNYLRQGFKISVVEYLRV